MGLTIEIVERATPGTTIVVLDGAWPVGRATDKLNDAEACAFAVANDDPDLAELSTGRLAIWKVDGAVAFASLIQRRTKVAIAPAEEIDQVTTVEGRNVTAILTESVIDPSRGPDVLPVEVDRAFSWASPQYDEGSYPVAWTSAVQIAQQSDVTPYWTGAPTANGDVAWVDTTAYWIGSAVGDKTTATIGVEYFRRVYTVATAGAYAVQFGAFYYGDMWVDGQHILSTADQIGKVQQSIIDLSAGDHTFAFVVQNVANGGDDPAGGILALHPLLADGTLDTAVMHSDNAWSMLAFPTDGQPGMTAGEIIDALLTESQARGDLAGLTWDFTANLDSNSDAWVGSDHPDVEVGTLFDCATKVGTDLLTFLQELAATYIDFWVDEALVLHVTNKGGRGTASGVTLHAPTNPEDPSSGNLLSLVHITHEVICNDALVAWSGGFHRVTDEVSAAAHGRRGKLLSLGAQQSIIAVEAVTDGEFVTFANEQTETQAKHRALGGWPYRPGDTLTCPDEDGVATTFRVTAVDLEADEDGVLSITPHFGEV